MKVIKRFLILFTAGLVMSSYTYTGPSAPKTGVTEKPYVIMGQMPQFPGGKAAMQKYIRQNLTYPFEALKHNVQGKIKVEFVVDKDGTLKEIRTVGPVIGYGLEDQAVKIFKGMPKWVPGKQDGIAVPVYMMIPILFTI